MAISDKEFEVSNTSYLKKDFYEIYPEILDLVNKISKRWDPKSSNESDPGVVLLKLLAFIADKNNYNIDKNILECFMPSVTQEDNMRKLCDMMGYEMSYYTSATTNITFRYMGDELINTGGESGNVKILKLNAFDTVVTNIKGDVNYIITEPVIIAARNQAVTVPAIEGLLVEIPDKVTIASLDDKNRYYLPEKMIAQNGVYITLIGDEDIQFWERVSNLNTHVDGSYVYKFGYDHKRQLPYVQFPKDIAELINDGLTIKYIRTTGSNGNVSYNTLTALSGKKVDDSGEEINIENTEEETRILISNAEASNNGADYETIDEAYNNFKKTIGTFDTLVTCRDYANKIYQLIWSDIDTSPLVGNIQVSDLRDDINRSNTITTFTEYGITSEDLPKVSEEGKQLISHFDLYLYPLSPIRGGYNDETYIKSFKPYFETIPEIRASLQEYKTISHQLKVPDPSDVCFIKCYYGLSVKLSTTYKVNSAEQNAILTAVRTELYKKFNSRTLNFGEDISEDTIFDCIANADSRIKNVSLETPEISLWYVTANGEEKPLLGSDLVPGSRKVYLDLIAKNILAGRIPLFSYDTRFNYTYGMSQKGSDDPIHGGKDNEKIVQLSTQAKIDTTNVSENTPYVLKANEAIQFSAPNFRTVLTYPVYVNYNWQPGDSSPEVIPDGVEYKLKEGDILYINYRDSNEVVTDVKYTATEIITNGVSKGVEKNIIRVSGFNSTSGIKKSVETTSHKFSKHEGSRFIDEGDITGFEALSAEQQIELRDNVNTTIDSAKQNYKCYWLTNNGKLPFDGMDGSYILQEGEYFFYTNQDQTDLVILGSGTKITHKTESTAVYEIDYNTENVDLDNVVTEGLSAFSSTNWKRIADNDEFKIEEIQFITLVEGDMLTDIKGLSDPILTNTLRDVKSFKYVLSSEGTPVPVESEGEVCQWKVRSRLDLNVGPKLAQKVLSNHSITPTIEDEEGRQTQLPSITDTTISTNYLTQRAGGENLDVRITRYDTSTSTMTEINDFSIMSYNYTTPQAKDDKGNLQDLPLGNYSDEWTKLSFQKYNDIELDVMIPKSKFGLIMFYCDNEDTTIKSNEVLEQYNASYSSEESGDHKIYKLHKGINVVKVSRSDKLTVSCPQTDAESSIVFSKLNIVDVYSDDEGTHELYDKLLDIKVSEEREILDRLKVTQTKPDGSRYIFDDFYYSCPQDISMAIDINTNYNESMSSPIAWFDSNNVCNKFVLPELNAGRFGKGITISPASIIRGK